MHMLMQWDRTMFNEYALKLLLTGVHELNVFTLPEISFLPKYRGKKGLKRNPLLPSFVIPLAPI